MERFDIAERDLGPGCRDIQVIGELDLAVAPRLEEVLDDAVAEYERILIGLERCSFIDSSGIAVILRAQRRMAERGRRLAAYGAGDQVLRILSLTGLTANGLVFDDAEAALAATGEVEPA